MVGRERPGDKFGTSQGHPGRLGRFKWKFTFKWQNVRGTDGTDDGTDGTCPRDRRDTNQGVSRQNSLCLLVFFFPHYLRLGIFAYSWPSLLTVIWFGIFYLQLKFGLVFFAHGGKSVWCFLLTVPPGLEIECGLFCWFPHRN